MRTENDAHLAAEVLTAINHVARDHAVVQDAALVIDVLEEQIQGRDTLRQAALNARPFLLGEDARQRIVGEDALGALLAAVDGEGDSLMQEGKIGDLLAAAQLARLQAQNAAIQPVIVRTHHPVRGDHLVVCGVQLVFVKGSRQYLPAGYSRHAAFLLGSHRFDREQAWPILTFGSPAPRGKDRHAR